MTHEKYGLGVISESNTDYTIIEFDEAGRKKFLTRLVTLESSDEPAPKRRRASRKKATKKATKKASTKKATTKAAASEKTATKSATAKKTTKAASSKKAS